MAQTGGGAGAEAGAKKGGSMLGTLALLALFLMGLVWLQSAWPRSTAGTAGSTAAATPGPSLFRTGDRVHLRAAGGKLIPVATDMAAGEALDKAQAAGDDLGLQELLATGRVFLAEPGTAALVIDREGILAVSYQIRVQDGPQKGKAGWVPREFVQP